MNLVRMQTVSPAGKAVLASAAGLAVLAAANYLVARKAERQHPPSGSFIEVDGVRLHYSDRGAGAVMPLAALALHTPDYILSLSRIGSLLASLEPFPC